MVGLLMVGGGDRMGVGVGVGSISGGLLMWVWALIAGDGDLGVDGDEQTMVIPISNIFFCFNFGFSFMEKIIFLVDVVGDGDEQINAEEVALSAEKIFKDYRAVLTSSLPTAVTSFPSVWHCPSVCKVKLNVDVALDQVRNLHFSIGRVECDSLMVVQKYWVLSTVCSD
ncbi:hypothetical protein Dsin_013239 [Dipteronia sinensis]|uniref:Uncharacterized protein n=1 Tax=Dipteronia sinensis TaxID=43782 RepID=A0AAE0AKU9_9ROSI|nr:hypothetical protein Dsin_013239 [Dipteronia sinensis]